MENESLKSLLHGRNFPASFHDETTTEIKVGNRTVQLIERIDKVFLFTNSDFYLHYMTLTELLCLSVFVMICLYN